MLTDRFVRMQFYVTAFFCVIFSINRIKTPFPIRYIYGGQICKALLNCNLGISFLLGGSRLNESIYRGYFINFSKCAYNRRSRWLSIEETCKQIVNLHFLTHLFPLFAAYHLKGFLFSDYESGWFKMNQPV